MRAIGNEACKLELQSSDKTCNLAGIQTRQIKQVRLSQCIQNTFARLWIHILFKGKQRGQPGFL